MMQRYRRPFLIILSIAIFGIFILNKKENWLSFRVQPFMNSLYMGIDFELPPSTPKPTTWRDVQEERQRQINDTCATYRLFRENWNETMRPRMFNEFYVNDKHKILYCSIPKVGCSHWKSVMIILSGKTQHTHPDNFTQAEVHNKYRYAMPRLSSFKPREVKYRLENYRKFLFVREPFTRLLSAFKDKFERNNSYYHRNYGHRLKRTKTQKPGQSNFTKEKSRKFQFREFIQYLINTIKSSQYLDVHWDFYRHLCHPCHVKFDFIGKVENIDEEAPLLLNHFNLSHLVTYPPSKSSGRTHGLLKKYFSELHPDSIRKLWSFYSIDSKLFGYDYPLDVPLNVSNVQ